MERARDLLWRAAGSSQTAADKDMAKSTFAQLPLHLVLWGSSHLDLGFEGDEQRSPA